MHGELLYRVDDDGFPTTSVIAYFDEEGNLLTEVDEEIIQIPITGGLLKPKWTGEEWVESLTQEEIEELKKQPEKELTEIEKLKISQAEQFETILEILGGM